MLQIDFKRMGYTVTGFSDVFRISAYFGCLLLDFVPIVVAEGYRKVSNISRTTSQNLNASRPTL